MKIGTNSGAGHENQFELRPYGRCWRFGGVDNLNAFKAQVNAAAQRFSTTFFDPVTVNITVETGDPKDKKRNPALSVSSSTAHEVDTSYVKLGLTNDVTSLDDLNTINAIGS